MSKQYAYLHAMAKTSKKFLNDWPKTVGGVALTSQLLTNGWTDKRTGHSLPISHLHANGYGPFPPSKNVFLLIFFVAPACWPFSTFKKCFPFDIFLSHLRAGNFHLQKMFSFRYFFVAPALACRYDKKISKGKHFLKVEKGHNSHNNGWILLDLYFMIVYLCIKYESNSLMFSKDIKQKLFCNVEKGL